jgi:hypothetical protein
MKYFCLLIVLCTCNATLMAAAKPCLYVHDTSFQAKPDTTDTLVKKASVSAGVSYGSDVQFFGRTGPIKYPYMSADAIYNTKNGFFLYTYGLKVLGYNPLFDEIDFGGGYLYHYSKRFTGTASYTHFFFNRDAAQVIRSASSNDVNWKNTYDWGFAKSSVTTDYLFGAENDAFVTVNITKHFESSFSIFDDKDYLTLDPGITAIMGTQNFVQRYAMDHDYRQDVDDIYYDDPDQPRLSSANSNFNILNYSIKIPIAYNRPHYTLEFAYKYSIPVNVEGLLKNHHESFYYLTFFYVFY